MPLDRELEKDNLEEEGEEEVTEGEKKGFLTKGWIKFLNYLGLGLGVICLSILVSIIVYELKSREGIVPYTNDISTDVSIPKDVYVIPELKLALDNNGEDSMNTILQVKIALAYEKENQSVLNEIINRKEQIRDRVQYVIAKKSYQEISTAESREQTLKKDLLYELRNIMQGEILDIYYDTFVISRIPG